MPARLGSRRRGALMALLTASAGIAMLSAGDPAYGTTFTFTTNGGDFEDPSNWTPTGVPGPFDLAKIRTLTAPTLTLNAANMTIGALLNDSSNVITLSNATTGPANSTLTIAGLAGTPLIELDRTVNTTTFTFQGANSSTGTGTLGLVLAASGDIAAAGTGAFVISADISEIGGPKSINKTGSSLSTVILSGSNSFTGRLTNNQGTLIISGNNAFTELEAHRGNTVMDFASNPVVKTSSGSLTTVLSGGTLIMTGNASQNVTQSFLGTIVNAGQNTASITVTGSGTPQLNATLDTGGLSHRIGAYLNINFSANSSTGGAAKFRTSTANLSSGILGGWVTVANNDWAINDDTGNVIAMPSASYAHKSVVSTWSTGDNITNDASDGSFTGTVNGIAIGSLRFTNGASNNTLTIADGAILDIVTGGILLAGTNGTTHTITGGILSTEDEDKELCITTGISKTLVIGSVIRNLDPGDNLLITKNGSGTLTLAGTSTYTGGLYINNGTVSIATIADTGTASPLGSDGTIHFSGTNAARLIYTGPAGASTNRDFFIGDGSAVIQLTMPTAGSVTFSGAISGPGGLTKGGTATSGGTTSLIVVGTKDFGGAVVVNPGLLSVDNLAPIGTPSGLGTGTIDSTVTLGSGTAGTLEFRGTAPSSICDRTLQLGTAGGGSINLVITQPVTLTWNGDMNWLSGQPLNPNITSITFGIGATNPRPFTLVSNGTLIFNGNIGTGTSIWGQLRKGGSGTVILGGSNGYAIGTTVSAGTLITATNFSNGTITNVSTTAVTGLNVVSGYARVAQKPSNDADNGTTAVPSLAIASGSNLDLTNNALIVYNTTSPLSQIKGLLQAGYNNGAWNGTGGIISSSAAASPSAHKTALGYAQASDLTLTGGTFYGRTVPDGTDALVAYVLSGDANLDGVVNALDFNALATGFGQNDGNQIWTQGDFNYDSKTNTLDFNALAGNFNMTTPIPSPDASLGGLVPEPTAGVLLVSVFVSLWPRRRHR